MRPLPLLLAALLAGSVLLAGCGDGGEAAKDGAMKQKEIEQNMNKKQVESGNLPAGDGPAG